MANEQQDVDRAFDRILSAGAALRIQHTGLGDINDLIDMDSSVATVALEIARVRAERANRSIMSHEVRSEPQRNWDTMFARARNATR